MLPTLVGSPPKGEAWSHEIKYDGYRTQLLVGNGSCRAFTRNGHDWTEKYLPVAKAAEALPCESAIIDGEIIVQDEQGRSDFSMLKAAIHQSTERLVFMAFDLLHLDGKDLRRKPLKVRREALENLMGENRPESPLQFSAHVEGDGAEFLRAADSMGLEGIVSKKVTSRYISGRTKAWLKTKTFVEDEFVVIGTSKGDRAPVALLARETGSELTYVGGAMVTLAQPHRDRFCKRSTRSAEWTRRSRWNRARKQVGPNR